MKKCKLCNKYLSCSDAPIHSENAEHLELCYYCYKGLSYFDFNIERLTLAIKYLKEKKNAGTQAN